MEATPSLVTRVAGSGRWKGKIGKHNFIGLFSLFGFGLLVGNPFQSLPKAQNPISHLPNPNQTPKYLSPPMAKPISKYIFYLSIHYSNNNYHSTKVIKHSNPHPYLLHTHTSYTPIPLLLRWGYVENWPRNCVL